MEKGKKCSKCGEALGAYDAAVRMSPFDPTKMRDLCLSCYLKEREEQQKNGSK